MLAYCVPDLQLHVLVVDGHSPRAEFHSDGQIVSRLESLVGELKQQARFTHAYKL